MECHEETLTKRERNDQGDSKVPNCGLCCEVVLPHLLKEISVYTGIKVMEDSFFPDR